MLNFKQQLDQAVKVFRDACFGDEPQYVSIPFDHMRHMMFLLEKYVPKEELEKPFPGGVEVHDRQEM